jgi:hypothetical protein
MLGELLAYQLVLQTTQDRFGLLQPQPDVLDPVTRALNRLDGNAQW